MDQDEKRKSQNKTIYQQLLNVWLTFLCFLFVLCAYRVV